MKYIEVGIVGPDQAGLTVGGYLKRCGYTEHQIRHAKYLTGGILRNGVPCRAVDTVSAGDWLQLGTETAETVFQLPWTILYQDGDVLVIDKPAGVVVHPAHGHYEDTLVYQLQSRWGSPVHLIGRLDKDTSGVLMIAKNSVAAQRLQQQRREGVLVRSYLAWVHGRMRSSQGVIQKPLCQEQPERNRMIPVTETQKKQRPESTGPLSAITKYTVMESYAGASLLQITIDTGRTHQIRVHLASEGHPLLGDPIYGGGVEYGISRTALHAVGLRWRQPFTGELCEAAAPIPEDLRELIPRLQHAWEEGTEFPASGWNHPDCEW